jgi:integrase
MNVEYTQGGKLIKKSNVKSDLLQSHTARRTFATNMYKRAIPIETIMAITGHKKSSTFYKYVQLPPDHHAKKLADIFNANY